MSDFKAKKAPNSISAEAPPQTPFGELAALPQTPGQLTPSPLSTPSTALRASKQRASPNICIPKSAYGLLSVCVLP